MLFPAEGLVSEQIAQGDLAELQRLLEGAPGYAHLAEGAGVGAHAARETYDARPPEGWSYSHRWLIGFRAKADGELVAIADVVSDLLARDVWHIGLFLLPEHLHGTGLAQRAYAALEAWIRGGNARWLRLGVIEGNARAERFWRRMGYVVARRREGVEMGPKTHAVLVMVKPLAGGAVEEYLGLVARDRPGAP